MRETYNRISAALILYDENKRFLLQLRDDIPTIIYPAHWGLFGGEVEQEEQVIDAFYREIDEELHYRPDNIQLYKQLELENGQQLVHLGISKITVPIDQLQQTEGQDMGLFTQDEIESGWLLSPRHGKKFKVVPPIMQCFAELFGDSNINFILS